jgi:hypothetical protein
MAALIFQTPRSGRPFGGIVNPFETTRPAPPPPPPTRPPPNANAWRQAFGPNPFNPATTTNDNDDNNNNQEGQPAGPAPANPPIWGNPDFQPRLPPPRQPRHREDEPYFAFQQRASQQPAFQQPAAAVPAAPQLGHDGTAGTAPEPIVPPLTVLAALTREAVGGAATFCAALAVRALAAAYGSLVFLWAVALPAVARLLAGLLWALAGWAVFGLAAWWLGAVFLGASARLFRASTGLLLGWSWKTPARSYGLRSDFTSRSVATLGGLGAECRVAAAAPGNGASLLTGLSTKVLPYGTASSRETTVFTEQCPADGPDLSETWNISFVWNVSITTVTAMLWNNLIEPAERDAPW